MRLTIRAALAASLCLLAPIAPALAQDAYPFAQGDFVEVAGISIDDGHQLDYARFLANSWRKEQDFALKQGWITGYEVLENVHNRPGEPDIYLVTRFANFATGAELEKREKAYEAYMQTNIAKLQAESGDRAKFRQQRGVTLLRVLKFRD